MKQKKILYFVIPCFNESDIILETAQRVKDKFVLLQQQGKISENSKICFVNDGSTDDTLDKIRALHEKDSVFSVINLSHNFGHQNALLAGLMTVKEVCDFTISMDADLQDDIEVIDSMIDSYLNGKDIVYGVRKERDSDSFFKKYTALGFYRIMKLMGVNIVYNHADYRLMSKRSLFELAKFKEVNLFLRGIIPLIGLNSDMVYYSRKARIGGYSKYPLKKMLKFAVNGITSFSTVPIQMITYLGFSFILFSLLILLYCFIQFFTGNTVDGWTFIVVSLWLLGGIILMSLGIIGEYIGKIYMETKSRPRYIVERFDDSNSSK